MRDRYLTVPTNEAGIRDYETGNMESDNLAKFILKEQEFEMIYNAGIFSKINSRCGLMIDDYESEIISADNLRKCADILSNMTGTFRDACMKALEYNTIIALDF